MATLYQLPARGPFVSAERFYLGFAAWWVRLTYRHRRQRRREVVYVSRWVSDPEVHFNF